MINLLWLSDLHVSTVGPVLGRDSGQACRDAVAWLAQHYADAEACVITGDLTEHGTEAEFRAVVDALDTLPMPWFALVGNHDTRAGFNAVIDLPPSALPGFVQYRVDLPAQTGESVRLLCLDSLVEGAGGGELCAERLAWLEVELRASADHGVLVFIHHPPFQTGVAPFDQIGLRNGRELMALLARHACVKHIFAGHVHSLFSGVCQGVPVATQRSVLLQAPPARPAWQWDSFAPADAPAGFGVITVDAGSVLVRSETFPSR